MSKRRHDHSWANNTVGHSSVEHRAERVRVLDGFSTPPIATLELMRRERLRRVVWEPAAGLQYIARVLARRHRVFTSDVHRWHRGTRQVKSFMDYVEVPFDYPCDLVTNPPFSLAQEFVEHAHRILPRGSKVCLLLRLQFLEGGKRGKMFARIPPVRVRVFSYRLPRMHRFFWDGHKGGSVLCFAWFVWVVGERPPNGEPSLSWIRRRD